MALLPGGGWSFSLTGASGSEDFAGIGMGLGVVTGARSFKIDRLGRLTGVSYEQVWTPFENVAECRAKKSDATSVMSGTITYSISMDYTGNPLYDATPKPRRKKPAAQPKPEVEEKPHSMADCRCGFYGYYDGSDDYHKKGYVSAVVEGYGETLIGERGFRAAKARIVALRIPKSVTAPLAAAVRRNYAEIPQFEKFSAMVAAFPCDAALDSDPTDPDFWTRVI